MKKTLALATTAGAALFATSAFANICDPSNPGFFIGNVPAPLGQCGVPVPEISALEGTAALAALAAIVLIAWERRRRAA